MSVAPEDWWLHCPHCDRWARAIDHGMVRIKARSKGWLAATRGHGGVSDPAPRRRRALAPGIPAGPRAPVRHGDRVTRR